MVPDSWTVLDSFVPDDHSQPPLGWGLRGEGLGGTGSPLLPQQASRAGLPRPKPSSGVGQGAPPPLSHCHLVLHCGEARGSSAHHPEKQEEVPAVGHLASCLN